MATRKQLKVTLIKSIIGRLSKHQSCVKGLGLRRIGHSVVVDDNHCIRGMINKVAYLLEVREI